MIPGKRKAEPTSTSSTSRKGRPRLLFPDLSSREQRRRSKEVAGGCHVEELVKAATRKARSEKHHVLAAVLKETTASPGRPLKIRKAIREASMRGHAECLSDDEALAVCVAADLSRNGYHIISGYHS